MSVLHDGPYALAETLRHDADVLYDGHLNRRITNIGTEQLTLSVATEGVEQYL